MPLKISANMLLKKEQDWSSYQQIRQLNNAFAFLKESDFYLVFYTKGKH